MPTLAAVFGGLALVAAAVPPSLSQAQGGLWEVARTGSAPVKLCLANPMTLAQFEHRRGKCERTVLRNSGSSARIHYACSDGAFGDSDVTVVTPRSLRVETQGISGNAPFKYTFQARRVGDCPAH
jgi:hypothetical protein